MSSRQIEMHWFCGACKDKNLGRHMSCQKCGKPYKNEKYHMPSDTASAPTITDPDLLRKAKAGPNWSCKFCGNGQRKLDGSCTQCGANQEFSTKAESMANVSRPIDSATGKKIGEQPKAKPAPKPIQYESPTYRSVEQPSFVKDYKRTAAISVGSIVGIGFLIWFIVWLVTPYKIYEKVVAFHWETVTHVDRYSVHAYEGFNPPYDAFDRKNLGSRWHHNEEVFDHYDIESYTVQEACGQTCTPIPRVCSENCTPNGNGFATCRTTCTGGGESCRTNYCSVPKTRQVAKYRTEPRYQDYYSWKVWEWAHHRDVKEYGQSNANVYWPSPEKVRLGEGLASGEAERKTEDGKYFIVLQSPKGKQYDYQAKSLDEYKKYVLGKTYLVIVPKVGSVEVKDIK